MNLVQKLAIGAGLIIGSLSLEGCTKEVIVNPKDDDEPIPQSKTAIITTQDDVFIYSIDPNENYNDGSPSCPNCRNALKLIPIGGFEGESHILLKYWFQPIPRGSQITSAKIQMRNFGGSTNNSADCVTFGVYEAMSVWFQSIATWNERPTYGIQKHGEGTLCGSNFNVDFTLDKNIIQAWVGGDRPNNGFVLVPQGQGSFNTIKVMPSYESDGRGISLLITYQ